MNVNLRPYYAEGSKSMGFEIAEQLGWKLPRHTVVPMASGSLLTKINKAYTEFQTLGLVDARSRTRSTARRRRDAPHLRGVQAGHGYREAGAEAGHDREVAGDRHAGGRLLRDPCDEADRRGAEDCTDEEIVEGIRLLAECEGIFAETAGGVTVACARKLIETGKIPADESVVLCITGNGLKTQEAILGKCGAPRLIKPSLREFEELIAGEVERCV